jgi:hypothetical protein
MRALILVAGACLAVSACTTPNGVSKGIGFASDHCAETVAAFQTVQALASVLAANGVAPKEAAAVAEAAFKGAQVAAQVCPILNGVSHADIERANARYGA